MSERQLKPLILLHGALGCRETLNPVQKLLSSEFDVHCPDLPGHGEHSDGRAFTAMSLVDYLHHYITSHELESPIIFGYSLGGYLALAHAIKYPDTDAGIVTLGTKLGWNKEFAESEITRLDPAVFQANAPEFAETLKKRHGEENWEVLLSSTADLLRRLGESPVIQAENVKSIKVPVKLCVGSEDKMVTSEETEEIASQIPLGSFHTLKGAKHLIEKVDPELIADQIREFAAQLNSTSE